MAYPTTIDSFTTKVDNVTTISASHINDLQTAVVAVETELAITTNRPKFLAYNSVEDANQTGAGAVATLDFDTEVLDTGADFAADVFTAPVTGTYLLAVQVGIKEIAAAMTVLELVIVTSNRSYTVYKIDPHLIVYASSYLILSGAVPADMDAGDTAYVTLAISNGAGNNADILATYTKFAGARII